MRLKNVYNVMLTGFSCKFGFKWDNRFICLVIVSFTCNACVYAPCIMNFVKQIALYLLISKITMSVSPLMA